MIIRCKIKDRITYPSSTISRSRLEITVVPYLYQDFGLHIYSKLYRVYSFVGYRCFLLPQLSIIDKRINSITWNTCPIQSPFFMIDNIYMVHDDDDHHNFNQGYTCLYISIPSYFCSSFPFRRFFLKFFKRDTQSSYVSKQPTCRILIFMQHVEKIN